MPGAGREYQRFDAGDEDPRKSYRTIAEIRAEQAEQSSKIATVEQKMDAVVDGQVEIMNFLRGTLKEPGLKQRVDGLDNALADAAERAHRHSKDIEALNGSRDEALMVVKTARWMMGIAGGTTVLAGIGWLLWFLSGGKLGGGQ